MNADQLMWESLAALNAKVAAGKAVNGICEELWAEARKIEHVASYLSISCAPEFSDLLRKLTRNWPEAVGIYYPVPAPSGFVSASAPSCYGTQAQDDAMAAFVYFYRNKKMWVGEYGDSRKRLLAYMTGIML